MQANSHKKIVVYSHDTFGLGNIRRMLAITEHLLDTIPDLSILLISGSPMIHSFRLPQSRFDYLKLPSIGRTLAGDYIAKQLGTNFKELVAVRSQIIQAALANFKPDVMIVDKKPRGIANEMYPTLRMIHKNMPATKVVLLLRDILDDPEVTRRIWSNNHYYQTLERYYHNILVMGSRQVFDVCREYHFPKNIVSKVVFCGYINRSHIGAEALPPALYSDFQKPRVLVTVGGGEDGFPQLQHLLQGLKQYPQSVTFSTQIVTGPEMCQQHKEEILCLGRNLQYLQIMEFTPDLAAHMQAADLIVSMAGYNTIVEILALNKRAIVIPRVKPVREQWIRASRLARLGLLQCIHPGALSPLRLMQEISAQLDKLPAGPQAVDIMDFDGLNTATRSIKTLLQGRKIASPVERVLSESFPVNNEPLEGPCSVFS